MQRRKDREAIDEEVLKTLHCLDNVGRLRARPFFYTRLKQRLDGLEAAESQARLFEAPWRIWRPVLVPALVAASVLLGVFIGYEPPSNNHSENLETFATAYGLKAPDLNDYLLTKSE